MSADLPSVLAGTIVVALTIYALTGGADFGGGVWDLLARGPRARAQRRLIADALAPIWEANHVWLIAVIVILFTAFPPAFGAIATALHIPLTAMLVGIVLRGSAFTFRSYHRPDDHVAERW
jgi:cytochrome d ubiquinol oxidase subunit II